MARRNTGILNKKLTRRSYPGRGVNIYSHSRGIVRVSPHLTAMRPTAGSHNHLISHNVRIAPRFRKSATSIMGEVKVNRKITRAIDIPLKRFHG